MWSFASNLVKESELVFFAQNLFRMNNVTLLGNEQKIYTKHGTFITLYYGNNTCCAECHHDPVLLTYGKNILTNHKIGDQMTRKII